jgi:hypothetical protein
MAGSERHEGAEHGRPLVRRMDAMVCTWEVGGDRRAAFLRCYMMMTRNTLHAIDAREFRDSAWVERLLHRFAEYYFEALDAYATRADRSPPVWRFAHETARQEKPWVIQHLLLGVNAHINFDLVLTLEELLRDEWSKLESDGRARRYEDYCQVNAIIAQTIDDVQDEVIRPRMPVMGVVDGLMGRLDEFLISRFITGWRDEVWKRAIALLESTDPAQREIHLRTREKDVMLKARAIAEHRWREVVFGNRSL